MKNNLIFKASVVAFIAIFALGIIFVSKSVQAGNTHSIDLEKDSSQHLSIDDASQTGLDLASDFTIEAWVKLESQPGSGNTLFVIASKYNDASSAGAQRSYSFSYRDSVGIKKLELLTSADGLNVVELQVNQTLSTGVWQHVAAVYDISAGQVEFFVDGSSIGTASGGHTSLNNSTSPFFVGKRDVDTGFFDGLIDEVRVWDDMRTATEISDNRLVELSGIEQGLVAYWKLNNSFADETSNNNALTNNNGAVFSTSAPFAPPPASLTAYKSANESLISSAVLQDDDELTLSLDANKTYAIAGAIFASSTTAQPDIQIAFFGPTGSDITIGYNNDADEEVLFAGDTSARISLVANTPQSIHINGTVKTGSVSGDFIFKWSQATSKTNATTVMKGSYLKAEEL